MYAHRLPGLSLTRKPEPFDLLAVVGEVAVDVRDARCARRRVVVSRAEPAVELAVATCDQNARFPRFRRANDDDAVAGAPKSAVR